MQIPPRILLLTVLPLLLSGCTAIGEKDASISIIYCVAILLSLLLLGGYALFIRRKGAWFWALFSSVCIVNVGYFLLSVSPTLELALHANRLIYLGSVVLPLSMLMIVLKSCGLGCSKKMIAALIALSGGVFLIAGSPGYSDIYYKEVTLTRLNGATVLDKVYGPLHGLYLVYLLAYLTATLAIIGYAARKQQIPSPILTIGLFLAMFLNTGVWLLEQLVKVDFELLSLSYILTELFLLFLYLIMQEKAVQEQEPASAPVKIVKVKFESTPEERAYFFAHLSELTPAEKGVYELHLTGKSTKEITETLGITENTLKYHNRNLYGKLGVSSRKQLLEIALSGADAEKTT